MNTNDKIYNFYGWESANIVDSYGLTPRDYYDLLLKCWCKDSCAPRLQDMWTSDNPTLGQCSITAFLMQDIYGGEVRGILRPGGNYHCFNVVGDCVFDLTSEQFGDEILDYTDCPLQSREVHFAKEEKRLRYEALKRDLTLVMNLVYKSDDEKTWIEDVAGERIALLDHPVVSDGVVNLVHTEVDPSYGGKGLAGLLTQHVAEVLRKKGWKATLTCSYSIKWFSKHPEYSDVLFDSEAESEKAKKLAGPACGIKMS